MLVYAKLLGAALAWGGTFVAGHMAAAELGPYSAAFIRFAIASVFLVALMLRAEGLPRLTPRLTLGVLLLGLTGVFGYNLCFFSGLALAPAGRSSVIIACNPIAIALFAALIFREPLGPGKILGILMSVSGAVWVISRGAPGNLLTGGVSAGDAWILGCVGCWVAYSLLGKAVMGGLSPLAAVTLSCVAGDAMLAVPALHEGLGHALPGISGAAWWSLVYLGVAGTVLGFTWFYEGVQALGPSQAGVFINFVPVSAVAMAWGFLGEGVDVSLAVGGVLVLGGVWCANRVWRKV
ncbi:DMT family transporter [Desulfocurvus sp. DL9XJH121]